MRPVIPALGGVDVRRPPELARHDQQHALVEAAQVQIFDEGRDRLVEEPELVLRVLEDVAVDRVRVPVVSVVLFHRLAGRGRVLHHHRDPRRARLDQPPREQGALAVPVHPVPLARLVGLPGQVEGVARLAREHEVDLSKIQGSGRDGRIMKDDVRIFHRILRFAFYLRPDCIDSRSWQPLRSLAALRVRQQPHHRLPPNPVRQLLPCTHPLPQTPCIP